MKRYSILLCFLGIVFFFVANTNATIIDHNGSIINYGTSWDNPSVNVEDILINYYSPSTTLTLVNGISNEIENWYSKSAVTIMFLEIAGYKDKTDFGWYNTDTYNPADNSTYGQIFDGLVSPVTFAEINFANMTNFGFYIDPNGLASDRMFTEHDRNSHSDYQVTIWRVNESQTDYILGWEDLDLNGSTGGDRDYQDMILGLHISPVSSVPEPATILQFGLGLSLFGIAGFIKRFKKS